MPDRARLSSPITSPVGSGRGGVGTARAVLRERPFLGKVMLRLEARDEREAAEACLGLPLPEAGGVTTGEAASILSLSRDAYLLVTSPGGQLDLVRQLRAVLSGKAAGVIDVSSGHATFRLAGPDATELLYRGCSTPLDAPAFARGRCITTKVGKIAVIIHEVDDAPAFDIHVPRSLALSLWDWLAEAGRDIGLMIEPGDAPRPAP